MCCYLNEPTNVVIIIHFPVPVTLCVTDSLRHAHNMISLRICVHVCVCVCVYCGMDVGLFSGTTAACVRGWRAHQVIKH